MYPENVFLRTNLLMLLTYFCNSLKSQIQPRPYSQILTDKTNLRTLQAELAQELVLHHIRDLHILQAKVGAVLQPEGGVQTVVPATTIAQARIFSIWVLGGRRTRNLTRNPTVGRIGVIGNHITGFFARKWVIHISTTEIFHTSRSLKKDTNIKVLPVEFRSKTILNLWSRRVFQRHIIV